MRAGAATALQNLVEILNSQGRFAEAEEALRDLASRFGPELMNEYDKAIAKSADSDPGTRFGLRYRRADLLHALGRTDEALAAFAELIAEFDDQADLQPAIDRARDRRAALTAGQADAALLHRDEYRWRITPDPRGGAAPVPQPRGGIMRSMRSSPGRTVPRPSRLLVRT